MECVNINVEELLELNEENLIMMLPPGRMGGDDTILVYKKDDKFFEYYIDGKNYNDEINTLFPKIREEYENYYDDFTNFYYFGKNYYILDMGMGCLIYIKKEFGQDFISNVKMLQEKKLKKELTIEDVLNSGSDICGVWREAASLIVNNIK